jgi:hypothetical protein
VRNTQATSNGIKILGEFVALPGISLLAEGRVGEGALYAGLGTIGGWLGGVMLGPLGYLLVRYGASAFSYYQSFVPPAQTTPPSDAASAAGVQRMIDYLQTLASFHSQQISSATQDLRQQMTNLSDTHDQQFRDLATRVSAMEPARAGRSGSSP